MHDYEQTQNFNYITKLLHKTRYRNLIDFLAQIDVSIEGRGIRVVDVGCGVAKTYSVLTEKYEIDYVGIELREDYCNIANERYGGAQNFQVVCDSIEGQTWRLSSADVVVGLESFEHIPERTATRVVEAIADSGCPFFYCSVPNEVGPALLVKNAGSALMGYSRYKEYSWRETLAATMYDLDRVGVHGTGHKGFDWRWLAQVIRQNMKIDRITTSPCSLVPRFLSPSIGFMCSARDAG